MSREVGCPACRHSFAPAGAGGVFPCPRCGWRVALSSTAIREEPPGEPAPATVPCPHCRRRIAEVCLFCPHCEQPTGAGAWPGRFHHEVPSVPAVLLAVVGMLSLALAVGAGVDAIEWRQDYSAGVVLLSLAGLTTLGALLYVRATPPPSGPESPGWVLLRTLGSVGIAALCAFALSVGAAVFCGLGLAGLVIGG
jgi:predicted RNA-binding Zn-ribbon protein involved in translation (DUF1610 family)